MNTQYLTCGVFSLFFIYVRNQKVEKSPHSSDFLTNVYYYSFPVHFKIYKKYAIDANSKISLISLEKVELTELSAE